MATMSLCCGALGTNLRLAKTRPEKSGLWGRRHCGFNLNNNAVINQLPKSLRIDHNAYMKIRPDFVASALTSDDHADLMTQEEAGLVSRETPNDKNVVSIILGGGAGTQLLPLTRTTATPAVALAGCYKMIDIPMSNCFNSGINKIFVLTQFNSASLNRHIHRTYHGRGINFGDGFVEVLAATQTSGEAGKTWFQGTADAVRKFLWMFEEGKIKDVENILILSGDHLYRMNYMEFVQNHIDRNADITISCLPVNESRASKYGLMKVDATGRVYEFLEKPKGNELNTMRVDTSIIGLIPDESYQKPFIASMGVYVFKVDVLLDLLRWRYPKCNDFGSEVIPLALKDYNVQAYHFNDYWEDIGTLQSFYEANLALTQTHPKFEFYDSKTPIYTSPKFLPPTKMDKCKFKEAIISHGCFLGECTVENSIVGERSRLEYGVEMKDTVMMGADYYQTENEITHLLSVGKVPIGVGVNSKIRKCIIDKNARIGKNVTIMNKDGVQEADRTDNGFCIRSGIVIVMEKATIADGTII